MKLSIITINLNNAAGLEKTAESIVSQTFNDFEWIVIDGGSTDGSVNVIRKYADRIAYWVSEKDSGIYNAMNKGVKVAKGEYLQFLNSGDIFVDNKVLEDILNIDSNNEIIYGDTLILDGDQIVGEKKYELLSFYFMLTNSINHQSTLIPRHLLLETPFSEQYKVVSDWEFFMKMILKAYSFRHIQRIICGYDCNGLSSVNVKLVQAERKEIINKLVPASIIYDCQWGKMGKLLELRKQYRVYSKIITFSH